MAKWRDVINEAVKAAAPDASGTARNALVRDVEQRLRLHGQSPAAMPLRIVKAWAPQYAKEMTEANLARHEKTAALLTEMIGHQGVREVDSMLGRLAGMG